VGVFSLEMSSRQLVTRMLCSEARVDSHRVRSGRLSKQDWKELAQAMSHLTQAKLFIDDTAGLSIMEMRSKARRLKSEHGLDLLIVDYLQLMSGKNPDGNRFDNREKEIGYISRSLKAMAKELDIPLIAISQLSRAPEQRTGNHRPQLSDLRESGSIEQDADVVLFIYREDMYKKREDLDEDSGVAEIIVGKQRNGPTGRVKLAFISEWTKFENLAYETE
jgi:replicative DNA helicase